MLKIYTPPFISDVCLFRQQCAEALPKSDQSLLSK